MVLSSFAIAGKAFAIALSAELRFVVQASVVPLAADKLEFEARCRRMLDADGTAMVDELCAEIEVVGRQMRVLCDGLDLTRARLRTAMAKLTATETTR